VLPNSTYRTIIFPSFIQRKAGKVNDVRLILTDDAWKEIAKVLQVVQRQGVRRYWLRQQVQWRVQGLQPLHDVMRQGVSVNPHGGHSGSASSVRRLVQCPTSCMTTSPASSCQPPAKIDYETLMGSSHRAGHYRKQVAQLEQE
jgi:hypothetical protein